MTGVLSGLRVLEFAAIGPVPWCGMVLADLGATVIRVERPDSEAAPDTLGAVNRGRKRVKLDLKSHADRDIALRMIEHADVLLEGFRPGVMERLGLGPDAALARNSRLIYGRMTGWGQSGPKSLQAGHDINYIALIGALHAIGTKERPLPPLNLVGDFGGGGAFLLIGVLSALWSIRQTGRGQVIDAAMVDGAAALMSTIYSRLLLGQWVDKRASNMLDGGVPWYGTYETSDGKFMAVGAIEPQFYAELVERLGLSGQLPDRSDPASWPEIRDRFTKVFATRTRDAWSSHFTDSDACVTPVLSLSEAPEEEHLRHRGTFTSWQSGSVPAPALVFDGVRPERAQISNYVDWKEALDVWSKFPDD